jgi:hypothetical protein
MLGHYTTPPTAHVMYHLRIGASTFSARFRRHTFTHRLVMGDPYIREDTEEHEVDQDEHHANQE